MYGLEAINAHNGWAISVVGITIVFSGLVTLSIVISQLHKVLGIWEDPSKIKAFFKTRKKASQTEDFLEKPGETTLVFSNSQKESAKQFALLARTMEDHFSLQRLLHLAVISDLPEPYSNLNLLYIARIIIPDGSGFFTWDKEVFNKLVS